MSDNKLIEFLDSQHRAYDRNFYSIIAQATVPNNKYAGVLRCFTYKGTPRFAILFETTPDNSAFDFASQWVIEKLSKTGNDSAMLWYSQCEGFSDDFLRRIMIYGEPYRFLEMHAERKTHNLNPDLHGLTKILYTPDMLDECIELLENSYTPFLDTPGSYRNDRERIMQMLENRNSARSELFFLNNSLVGLYSHNDGAMECICVHPDIQGKGFGESILRSALSAIKYDTKNAPQLTVACKNVRAISLYKKCGFKIICQSARVIVKI